MEYNIVTNYKIIQETKKYKHYKVSLGYSSSVDIGDGVKVLSDKDKFAFFYNKRYKTTIYGQGIIGNINFYTDHYIKEDVVAIYFGEQEFIFDFDFNKAKEKGIEWYLGSFLKKIHEEIGVKETIIKEEASVGNPDAISQNPGRVTWADIVAFNNKKKI
jgi:hypothetical protein